MLGVQCGAVTEYESREPKIGFIAASTSRSRTASQPASQSDGAHSLARVKYVGIPMYVVLVTSILCSAVTEYVYDELFLRSCKVIEQLGHNNIHTYNKYTKLHTHIGLIE